MKKMNNKLAMALLRGVVALSGIMATVCFALFAESLNSLFVIFLLGVTTIVLVDEYLKNLSDEN